MSSIPVLPPRFPDPKAPPKPEKTLSRWDGFLGSIAAGTQIAEAMLKHYIKRADIEAVTRSDKTELKRFKDAKLAGLRQAYSQIDLDEFFDRVAMGTTTAEAFMQVFGYEAKPTFYRLLREDPELEEQYSEALKTKATLEMEKALSIIDDDSNDTLPGPKGGEIPNMAAVQRSRLKFDGRSKLASHWYRRLYGEQKDKTEVTVTVNLAERLERGIQNLRDRKVTPRQMNEAIDATYEPVQPAQDSSWMEDKPTDTMWLEEK